MTIADQATPGVFSNLRTLESPPLQIPPGLPLNARIKMDGLELLGQLPDSTIPVAFLDPQFRGVYDKLKYGNEKTSRNHVRVELPQMSEATIVAFTREIARILIPSGHLFLWTDKFHLCSDFRAWSVGTPLSVVDMVTWDKEHVGLGYRTRHRSEFCIIMQKEPRRAKGVWTIRNIPDVWREQVNRREHPHNKPVGLQAELIEAVTSPSDVIVDPAAGSFSVLEACRLKGRNFLGCDILG